MKYVAYIYKIYIYLRSFKSLYKDRQEILKNDTYTF